MFLGMMSFVDPKVADERFDLISNNRIAIDEISVRIHQNSGEVTASPTQVEENRSPTDKWFKVPIELPREEWL